MAQAQSQTSGVLLQTEPSQKTISIPFIKMHGLGNDFVMICSRDLPAGISLEKLAAFVCDRHFGIGADGLIVDAEPTTPAAPDGTPYDIRFIYLNGDGSWAEMCGNGIRCFARFVEDKQLSTKSELVIETLAGPIKTRLNVDKSVTVDMGAPILQAAQVPFAAPGVLPDAIVENYQINVLEQSFPINAVSMGNPHCLIFQDDHKLTLDPSVFGPALEKHPAFPKKTNVEFLKVQDEHTMDCVVWERGCGFTLACGTGACASAVSGIRLGKVKSPVQVHLPGGPLLIEWAGDNTPVYMTGPATMVFSGTIAVPEFH